MNKNIKGFSMTEMSIVIIIIAILLGAMLKGKDLIDKAKIRAIISESAKHKVSFNSFYSKYTQYPGDFDEAEVYWGASNTDSGDNDGQIEFKSGTVYEGYRAWQHLTLAEMIEGNYVCTATAGGPCNATSGAAVIDVDVPGSKSNGGYFFEYGAFGLTENNSLVLGYPVASSTTILVSGILTPEFAFEIDSKVDDGNPVTGNVRGKDGNGSSAGSCVSGSIYVLSVDGVDCTMAFKMYKQ